MIANNLLQFASVLGLDSSFFASGDTSPAYLIWQYVQGFSNVLIIVILLFVIFSQLTGFGIDNYGIKKILPKIIVMAIVINLSYVLCQIAVDLSNIIGNGLKGMCTGISDSVWDTLVANGTVNAADRAEIGFSAFFATLFGAGAGAAVAASTALSVVAVAGSAIWWIPLLITAIIGLIAVLMFFVILALRNIITIVLVAISPLALVCYILPNTQKLFNKWLDLFKAMLVIYPVCAGLYGISKLMKVITYSASGTHILMVMVAILSTFVPFFVAPSLIKKSLNALGNLGNKMGSLGERLKGGVRSGQEAIKGTAKYQDALRTTSLKRAESRVAKFDAAKRKAAELGGKENLSKKEARQLRKFKRLSGQSGNAQQDSLVNRLYAANQQAITRAQSEDIEAQRVAMREETGDYDVNLMGAQLNNLLDKIDKEDEVFTADDENKLSALFSQLANQSGGAKKIYEAANGRTGESAQKIGSLMGSNDKVRSALEGKGRRVAARIADIASGTISANTSQEAYDNMNNNYLKYLRQQRAAGNSNVMSQADWKASTGDISTTTVIQSIANDVLDKDKDLVTQSGAEVKALVSALKSTPDGQARIDRMAADSNLYAHGDIAEGVRQTISANATPLSPPEPRTMRVKNMSSGEEYEFKVDK